MLTAIAVEMPPLKEQNLVGPFTVIISCQQTIFVFCFWREETLWGVGRPQPKTEVKQHKRNQAPPRGSRTQNPLAGQSASTRYIIPQSYHKYTRRPAVDVTQKESPKVTIGMWRHGKHSKKNRKDLGNNLGIKIYPASCSPLAACAAARPGLRGSSGRGFVVLPVLWEVCHGFKYPVVFRTSADSMEFEAMHRTYSFECSAYSVQQNPW